MPEVLTSISEWIVDGNFPNRIASFLTEQASPHEIHDICVQRGEIFGISLTYERIVKRTTELRIPIEYRYAIYADTWVLELVCDPHTLLKFEDLVWLGRGDYEKWLKDATLMKLFGV